ncbi:MAG: cysteine--tRNA ligase [Candidatus Aenigmarchaeota archaeon]|nr:cysteine--tRNA ligase [Candidatus Aenigmarchaeota archaeon]NIP40292.1 cysteine--tRNA ligase [Candidatus Aenigmarchaeota archaeon]NIQ17784.1 cysteine--tRNA ligase [Candidatus Aenigmarchaeota archaeon]NIS73167.1 cysteine--tRNA ligase [Candidatus Aenigmarchaeota archaeon]
MVLKFHNTLTRKKDEFKPLKRDFVRIYSCGPTVYDYPHVGNLRAFVFYDLLRRYLKYRGFKVKQVMNITDVDDKTIRNSRKEGLTLKNFTQKYVDIFFDELKEMNVEKFEIYPKATEHIREMVDLVKVLLKKGFAYKGRDGSIYYKISKFKKYGKLSKLDVSKLKAGARVSQDEYTKEEARDFSLWKAWNPDDGNVFWETDIGKGRPGWHIECSVMSTKYLGPTLDIHTGGVDLIFPHHENEIAQSEAPTGKPFVRFWLHNEHVMVEGKKMSKSLGNYLTLKDLIERGHDPLAVRYALLSTHYRSKLNITDKALWSAKQSVEKIRNFVDLLKEVKGKKDNRKVKELIRKVQKSFGEAMDDDLDIGRGLAKIFDFIREVNRLMDKKQIGKRNAQDCLKTIRKFDRVLGILKIEREVPPETLGKLFTMLVDLHETLRSKDRKFSGELERMLKRMKGKEIDPEHFGELIDVVVRVREDLREKRMFDVSDKIRSDLKDMGIILEDKEKGVRWRLV